LVAAYNTKQVARNVTGGLSSFDMAILPQEMLNRVLLTHQNRLPFSLLLSFVPKLRESKRKKGIVASKSR